MTSVAERTTDSEGRPAWRVTVDGQELGEWLFHKKPSYTPWQVGDAKMRVAVHEVWCYRGGPDRTMEVRRPQGVRCSTRAPR